MAGNNWFHEMTHQDNTEGSQGNVWMRLPSGRTLEVPREPSPDLIDVLSGVEQDDLRRYPAFADIPATGASLVGHEMGHITAVPLSDGLIHEGAHPSGAGGDGFQWNNDGRAPGPRPGTMMPALVRDANTGRMMDCTIVVHDPNQRAQVQGLLNERVPGEYAVGADGQVSRTRASGLSSEGRSAGYAAALDAAIASPREIDVSVGPTYDVVTGTPPRTETRSLDSQGGGVTIPSTSGNARVIISGGSINRAPNLGNRPLEQSPADILMHELGSHAIPFILGYGRKSPGNAIDLDNAYRLQAGLPLRAPDRDHLQWKR